MQILLLFFDCEVQVQQSPVVILYYDKRVNLYQNKISGYSVNAQNLLVLKNIVKAP